MKNRSFVLATLLSAIPLLPSVVRAQPADRPQVAPERTVTITGEVLKPGTYNIGAAKTLSSLLALAGGATNNANLERVSIYRIQPNITTDFTINFAKLTDNNPKGKGNDFLLSGGDKITVRATKPIRVMGNVARPGTYKLPNEGTLSVERIVLLAGGIQEDGPMKIYILRQTAQVGEEAIIGNNQTVVQPGDVIAILPKTEKPKD